MNKPRQYPELLKANVFAIDAGAYFKRPACEVFMVYSPLADRLILAKENEVMQMELFLQNGKPAGYEFPKIAAITEDLTNYRRIEGYTFPQQTVDSLTKLSILPNHKCNFSCSYCFSAKGRSERELNRDSLIKGIDYFINPQRTKSKSLFISILGGGEPLLSWELVKFAIKYAHKRAAGFGIELGMGLSTNGSITHPDLIEVLKKYHVRPNVSFEILEEIQNLQRGCYKQVRKTIRMLLENGLHPIIKPSITKINASRIEEMIYELISNFRGVTDVKLQPVEDPALFKNEVELKEFYNTFTESFFNARTIARNNGIDLYCLISQFNRYIKDHYCGGEFCLTPEGSISICHRFSSSREKFFSEFQYGTIDNEMGVAIDHKKFNDLISFNLYTQDRCRACFAKWHCGGGCMAQARIYSPEMQEVVCGFHRDVTSRFLFERLIDENKSNVFNELFSKT